MAGRRNQDMKAIDFQQSTRRRDAKWMMASFAVAVLLGSHTQASSATTLTWDGGDATSNGTFGGMGTWDFNTTPNWDNGTSDVNWTDNSALGRDIAVFTGSSGAISYGNNVSALGLQFLSSGYTITGAGGTTLRIGSGGINAGSLTSGTIAFSGINYIFAQGAQNWSVGSGTSLDLGSGTFTRIAGTTIQFTSAAGSSILATPGTASTVLLDGSTVYATVNGTDWAAKDATNTKIVAGSTIGGFYTNTTTTTASGNADAAVATTTVATGTSVTTLRFNGNAARTVKINGTSAQFTTGGILVTGNTGGNVQSITTGRLLPAGGTELNVIVNNGVSTTSSLVISAAIFGGAGNLINVVKSGSGTLTLSNLSNLQRGTNYINEGILNITGDGALGANGGTFGQIAMNGGTLQLGATITFTSARNTTLNTNGGTFDTNGNAGIYGGVIQGVGQLTKAGTGTFDVTNTNTYAGGTVVAVGTLKTDAAGGTFGTGNVSVNSGAVLELDNSNSIADTATLTIAGSGTTAAATIDLAFVSPATEYVGSLNLGGTVFAAGTVFNSGNSYLGYGSYFTGSTADSSLQVGPVPEPSCIGLAGMAFVLLLKRQRRV